MSRFYSTILHLYPAAFRAEYSAEMQSDFGARLRQAKSTGSRIALHLDALLDVIRNAAGAHWDVLRQDLNYAARTLIRAPGFTVTAVVVTALGIGANTAAFTVADFVLLRPLPYRDADRLVKLWQRPDGGGTNEASPRLYTEWKASAKSFESMGAFYSSAVNLVGRGEPQRIESIVVTADLLPILSVRPILGRLFTASEEREGAAEGVILSHDVWQGQFGSDPGIVGRQITLDGAPRVVIGVMPRDFHFPRRDIGLWTLISAEQQRDDDVSNTYWNVLGKLRPGVSLAQARAEMDVIARRIQQEFPNEQENTGISVITLRDESAGQSRLLLLALCGAAGCVLLIACANLANLLLARAMTRRREILVRTALGAGRERLVRQSMTESLVLAGLGGALGILIAYLALPVLTSLVPASLPVAQLPSIDMRVLAFAALLTAITGIGFGVLPAWRSAGQLDLTGLREGARSGGGRRERARSVLVVAEVIASVVLLISAGLLMRALLKVQKVDLGFSADQVLTVRTALPSPEYDTTARRVAFYRDVIENVRAIPGVSSAAYISGLPTRMYGGIWPVIPEGQTLTRARAELASSRFVTPGYFATMKIPVKLGRDIVETDRIDQPWVAVVSESFVKRYYPNEDPIGKRFKFQDDMRTIVGVVRDVRVRGPERQSEPQVYLSAQQAEDGANGFYQPKDLVVRSNLPASSLVPAIRNIVQRVDPRQPVSSVRMLSDVVAEITAARTVQVRILVAFAIIAFLLAAVGIHGLLSYTVSSRQHEIGIRMALGAQQRQIVRLVMLRGVMLALAGVLPGLFLAYAAAKAMQSLLAGIEPSDPVTFLAAGALCVVMTLVGSLLPTMRAVRVDPATAFRSEA